MRIASTDDLSHHAMHGPVLVFQQGQQLQAVECKSGVTYSADWMGPARRWYESVGPAATPPVLVYGGASSHARSDHQIPFRQNLGLAAS